jgi:hypothetical protein
MVRNELGTLSTTLQAFENRVRNGDLVKVDSK